MHRSIAARSVPPYELPVTPRTPKPRKATPRRPAKPAQPSRRADFGAPIEGFLAKQPPPLRAILDELRKTIAKTAPDATASLKWGMPFYALEGEMMCATGAHKSHVNLILPGEPGTYADPEGLLEGAGKTGQHVKIRTIEELPRAAVRGWIVKAAKRARDKGRAR